MATKAGLIAGVTVLVLMLVINAAAGSSDCVSNIAETTCYNDPGPSLLTSVLASLVAAVGVAVVRARRRP